MSSQRWGPCMAQWLSQCCEKHWVVLATWVLFPFPHSCHQDGHHPKGSHQHPLPSCTRPSDEREKGGKRPSPEQRQCSRFHHLQKCRLENSDSSQRVPTHQSLRRALSFWHTWSKHQGAFKMRAVQSLGPKKWLAALCQTGYFSKSLGKAGVSRMFLEKRCSRISDIWAF